MTRTPGSSSGSRDGDCKTPVPSAVSANGIIYTSRGYNSGPYLVIRPGGKGDVSGSHMQWRMPTGAPYVSSLLYYQDLIYMATEVGVVRCIDPGIGETILDGARRGKLHRIAGGRGRSHLPVKRGGGDGRSAGREEMRRAVPQPAQRSLPRIAGYRRGTHLHSL